MTRVWTTVLKIAVIGKCERPRRDERIKANERCVAVASVTADVVI